MNLNKYILINGKVYYQDKISLLNIGITNGLITYIGKDIPSDYQIIDCTNKLISPSFIDMHVHFRSPGYEYKEDIISGSKAALKGGYRLVCEMPNTKPCLDNEDTIKEHLLDIKNKALYEVKCFSACSYDLLGQKIVDIDKISQLDIVGFSDDGKGIQSDELMKEALIKAGKYNLMVSAHCEDEEEFINGMGCVDETTNSNLKGINHASEYKMIARDIKILEEIHHKHHYQYHVCHISCLESLKLVEEAKEKGLKISCEVTPHHLISNVNEIDINNSNYKMNPPLRSIDDVNYLVEGLNKGSIDVIATDHAPHSQEEKANSFEKAPFGIIGLELSFALLNTYLIKTNKVKLEKILACMSLNPSKLLKLEHDIALNKEAYLNIIDLDKKVVFNDDNIVSKSKNTFYKNKELYGKVETNIFKDKIYRY